MSRALLAMASFSAIAVLLSLGVGCAANIDSPPDESEPPARTAEQPEVLAPHEWTEISPMTEARTGVAAKLLDGRVLVAGGSSVTAEVYDPHTGTWARTGNDLPYLPDDASAETLADGRVLVGGKSGSPWKSALYDPAGDMWTLTKSMPFGDAFGRGVLLDDGRVLSAGGYSANTRAQLFDPATGQWHATANTMVAVRWDHTTTKLADGRVLVIGGADGNGFIYRPIEIYSPATGKWTAGKKTLSSHVFHTATLLRDGAVMVVAGEHDYHPGSEGVPGDSTEVYSPATGDFTPGPPLRTARSRHTATLLPNGALLVTGGFDSAGSALASAEVYDGAEWTAIEPMHRARTSHTATLLDDGRVLVAGGDYQATAEIFQLDPNGTACSTWGTCASGHCAGGVCCETACDDGCRSCAVPGFEGTCITPCIDDTHVSACPSESVSCAPYRCDQARGACGAGCQSVHDCAAGFVCNLAQECVAPPDVAGGDPGACGVRASSPEDGTKPWTGLLLILAILLRRRARRAPVRGR